MCVWHVWTEANWTLTNQTVSWHHWNSVNGISGTQAVWPLQLSCYPAWAAYLTKVCSLNGSGPTEHLIILVGCVCLQDVFIQITFHVFLSVGACVHQAGIVRGLCWSTVHLSQRVKDNTQNRGGLVGKRRAVNIFRLSYLQWNEDNFYEQMQGLWFPMGSTCSVLFTVQSYEECNSSSWHVHHLLRERALSISSKVWRYFPIFSPGPKS